MVPNIKSLNIEFIGFGESDCGVYMIDDVYVGQSKCVLTRTLNHVKNAYRKKQDSNNLPFMEYLRNKIESNEKIKISFLSDNIYDEYDLTIKHNPRFSDPRLTIKPKKEPITFISGLSIFKYAHHYYNKLVDDAWIPLFGESHTLCEEMHMYAFFRYLEKNNCTVFHPDNIKLYGDRFYDGKFHRECPYNLFNKLVHLKLIKFFEQGDNIVFQTNDLVWMHYEVFHHQPFNQ